MTKYEELAKQINEIDELTDEKFRFKVAALLERELAPLVEAANRILQTYRTDWSAMTPEEKKWAALYGGDDVATEQLLRSALKGWTR